MSKALASAIRTLHNYPHNSLVWAFGKAGKNERRFRQFDTKLSGFIAALLHVARFA